MTAHPIKENETMTVEELRERIRQNEAKSKVYRFTYWDPTESTPYSLGVLKTAQHQIREDKRALRLKS